MERIRNSIDFKLRFAEGDTRERLGAIPAAGGCAALPQKISHVGMLLVSCGKKARRKV